LLVSNSKEVKVVEQDAVLQRYEEAQERLREGLESIDDSQARIFKHLENMAAHVVAIEAVLSELAYSQTVSFERVSGVIRDRIGEQNLGSSASESAIGVARFLIRDDNHSQLV
jgi:hypothetical protein